MVSYNLDQTCPVRHSAVMTDLRKRAHVATSAAVNVVVEVNLVH